MKVTNTHLGPRGFYKGDELITLERGETWEGDLTDAEQKAAKATGYFGFGDAAARGAQEPEGDDLTSKLAAETARADTAEAQLVHALAENDELKAKLAALDGDGDGQPGGSKPASPPALTGKTKADLLDIAKAEGVTVADDATNAQIVDAIEAKRAAA